ncbi:unnamed protein product [Linum tenue]|uniref:Large ribosomal subunit protein bL25 beta domain-containing protein n=1 Tax=Linum tenue TaxID=586396 RepID=A0AAV0L7Z9_9ROSI|nr:unnamed protein product [Linum tenue]
MALAKWWRGMRTAAKFPPPSVQSLYSQSSPYHTIQAVPREATGSRVAGRERTQGRIPAVVFTQNLLEKNPNARSSASSSRKRLLTTEKKQIQAILRSVESPFFCSTTFPLQIRAGAGSSVMLESGNVLPIHREEGTGKILNLVFVWADPGTELKVDVPVVFKGEENCPGLQKGGRLNQFRTTLKLLCPAENIPQKIEVDLSNLDIGERIFMRDISLHPSLKLLSKDETTPVCKVVSTDLKTSKPALA